MSIEKVEVMWKLIKVFSCVGFMGSMVMIYFWELQNKKKIMYQFFAE